MPKISVMTPSPPINDGWQWLKSNGITILKYASLGLCLCFTHNLLAITGNIAMVQYTADDNMGNKEKNIEALMQYADKAIQAGANIILFPEGSTWGYQNPAGQTWCTHENKLNCLNVKDTLESIPNDPTTARWVSYSKTKGVFIIFFIIESDQQQIHRTAVITGPDGYVGSYRKRHLWENEKLIGAVQGDKDFILSTPWGKFGILICYDIWFGHVETYKQQGVDAIFLLSDWTGKDATASFRRFARQYDIDFYVTDDRYTDGTGYYQSGTGHRSRSGISRQHDGVTIHQVTY